MRAVSFSSALLSAAWAVAGLGACASPGAAPAKQVPNSEVSVPAPAAEPAPIPPAPISLTSPHCVPPLKSASPTTSAPALVDAQAKRRYRDAQQAVSADEWERGLELLGELLIDYPGAFDAALRRDPLFTDNGNLAPEVAALLETGGAWTDSRTTPTDAPSLDVECNGQLWQLITIERSWVTAPYPAILQHTTSGYRVLRVPAGASGTTWSALLPWTPGYALIYDEHVIGHGAEARWLVVRRQGNQLKTLHSENFILDGGDSDEPPPPDGPLWLSVIDVQGDPTPELIATHLESQSGDPRFTVVYALEQDKLRRVSVAPQLEQRAASIRRSMRAGDRGAAEAVVRLLPEDEDARLQLLQMIRRPPAPGHLWVGFFPPGSNNDIALHASHWARRHGQSPKLNRLAVIPALNHWLKKHHLSLEQLAQSYEPLLPATGLWSRASYLEDPLGTTGLGYFFFAEPAQR